MSIQIKKELPPPIADNTYVAIDTEWFGLEKNRMHRPGGRLAALTICIEPGTVYLIEDKNIVPIALGRVENGIWVMHNAKFDITQLRAIADIPPRTRLIDTMLMDKILYSGYYDRFSLSDLARRYLDIHIDKSAQTKFETASEMSDELVQYAVQDASIQMRIWMEQKKHITKTAMRIYREIDLPALWAVLDFMGFRIDSQAWIKLMEANRQKQEELEKSLPFNPRSYKQAKEALRKSGFPGLQSTNEGILLAFARRYEGTQAAEWVKTMLESRKYATWVSRYGENILNNYAEEQDGCTVIYGNYNVIGAESGRMSCSNPNMQNLPSRETKDFRKCFVPRDGNVLLIADYGAQEMRIMAYLSQDEGLIELLNNDEVDIYCGIVKRIFGKEITKSDPLRTKMKSTILGINYGMSEHGLAKREEISEEEAKDYIRKYFDAFPGVKLYIHSQSRKTNYAETVAGRRIWLNPYSSQVERNAINFPIQGTAADITKKALGRLYSEWRGTFDFPFPVVGIIHDEIIMDVPERRSDEVSEFLCSIMSSEAENMCPGVKFSVSVTKGKSWGDK